MSSYRRLQKEIKDIQNNPLDFISAGPYEDELYKWRGTLMGPENTPYYGGIFNIKMDFPVDYPIKAPVITFRTKIYHPNICFSDGSICLDILREQWSPALSIQKILLSVVSLLNDPNPNDPLEPEIAQQFRTNYDEYYEAAQNYTYKYAC